MGVGGGEVPEGEDPETMEKLLQMRGVLEKGGRFSGINRKVQLKPLKWVAREPPRSKPPSPPRDLSPNTTAGMAAAAAAATATAAATTATKTQNKQNK